jgi:hypothetical protein
MLAPLVSEVFDPCLIAQSSSTSVKLSISVLKPASFSFLMEFRPVMCRLYVNLVPLSITYGAVELLSEVFDLCLIAQSSSTSVKLSISVLKPASFSFLMEFRPVMCRLYVDLTHYGGGNHRAD